MANPTLENNTLARRKPIGEALGTKDTLLPTMPTVIHNATPPTLADGDVVPLQGDDMGNVKVSLGDPAQLAIFEKVAAGVPVPGWTTTIDESSAPATTVITYSYGGETVATKTITVSGTTTKIAVT